MGHKVSDHFFDKHYKRLPKEDEAWEYIQLGSAITEPRTQ